MPIWVDTKERLPELKQHAIVEYWWGAIGNHEYLGGGGWWLQNIKRWLDESENNTPSFSIEDMKRAYDAGYSDGKVDCGDVFDHFMNEYYNS